MSSGEERVGELDDATRPVEHWLELSATTTVLLTVGDADAARVLLAVLGESGRGAALTAWKKLKTSAYVYSADPVSARASIIDTRTDSAGPAMSERRNLVARG